MKKESQFQRELMNDIRAMLPGCVIVKNDSGYIQGFPDWTIFYEDRWAVLEAKRGEHERKQPNQAYYVSMLNRMSYASFIFPENKEQVLYELQQALTAGRPARVP